jgi:hypothetical protein
MPVATEGQRSPGATAATSSPSFCRRISEMGLVGGDGCLARAHRPEAGATVWVSPASGHDRRLHRPLLENRRAVGLFRPVLTPRRGHLSSATSGTPSGCGQASAEAAGGIAPLNHRLMASNPPGSCPLVRTRSRVIPKGSPRSRVIPKGSLRSRVIPKGSPRSRVIPKGSPRSRVIPKGSLRSRVIPKGSPRSRVIPKGSPTLAGG